MGHGHFSPNGTRHRFSELIDYRGKHAYITEELERFQMDMRENAIIDRFTHQYSFKELKEREWVNDYEAVVAETRHGAELRFIYHPTGRTFYCYVAVVTTERNKHNLAIQHLETYHETVKQALNDVFGNVRRKTSAWTSEKIEVKP